MRTPLQAEIKDRAAARVLAGVIDELGLHERVTVISFHDDALARDPHAAAGDAAGARRPAAPRRPRPNGRWSWAPAMVSCELRWLEAETVERCHAEGIKVISWTVNTDEELALARELGLDGVVTDLPEIKTAAQPSGLTSSSKARSPRCGMPKRSSPYGKGLSLPVRRVTAALVPGDQVVPLP